MPGRNHLYVRFGQFSHLWIDLAKRLDFDGEQAIPLVPPTLRP